MQVQTLCVETFKYYAKKEEGDTLQSLISYIISQQILHTNMMIRGMLDPSRLPHKTSLCNAHENTEVAVSQTFKENPVFLFYVCACFFIVFIVCFKHVYR